MMQNYFYEFIKPIYNELTQTLQELENAIYSSPRSMLTHSRTFIEALLEKVMIHEDMKNEPFLTMIERIQDLRDNGLLTDEVHHALHEVRKLGNYAAHDTRQFRFSESLTAWEHIYTIVKWFIEVYGSHDIVVPEYVDPIMKMNRSYDLEEMTLRFKKLEDLLKQSLKNERPKQLEEEIEVRDTDSTKMKMEESIIQKEIAISTIDETPGFTTIRTITYRDDSVDIPYFLRDVFLLPQRFEESERFLVRLGGEEEARLMSELPNTLEGFHTRITRYKESHSETFFNELKQFIAEEKRRKKLTQSRPGELFLFYNSDEIVVTEDLGKIEINKENFTGIPSLIDQLNKDGIHTVLDLPKELLIIGKYKQVGKSRVERFFRQLKAIQKEQI